jgi:hypothetical protein
VINSIVHFVTILDLVFGRTLDYIDIFCEESTEEIIETRGRGNNRSMGDVAY